MPGLGGIAALWSAPRSGSLAATPVRGNTQRRKRSTLNLRIALIYCPHQLRRALQFSPSDLGQRDFERCRGIEPRNFREPVTG